MLKLGKFSVTDAIRQFKNIIDQNEKRTEAFYANSEYWLKKVVRVNITTIGFVKNILKEEALPGLDVDDWIAWYDDNHGDYSNEDSIRYRYVTRSIKKSKRLKK